MEDNETSVTMIYEKQVEVIIIEEGTKRIEKEAFRHCLNLKELHLPKSITYIGDKIF